MKVYLITLRMDGIGGDILINVMIYSSKEKADKAATLLAQNSSGTYSVKEFEVIS
jgi:hypothetical protein